MGMREFQQRQRALQQINQTTTDTAQQADVVTAHASQYHTLEIALQNDVNGMKAYPSFQLKAERKRDYFLPKWLPYVKEYLARGEVYQNDYFVWCIVYLFDVGDLDQALRLSEIAIEQGQSMPQNFSQGASIASFTADQIYEWANKTAQSGQSVEPYFTQTLRNVVTRWQLHEVVTAKWLKFAAALLLRNEQGRVHAASVNDPESLELAIALCWRAFQFNHKAGVKNMIERCVMRLSALDKLGLYEMKFDENGSPQVAQLSANHVEINIARVIEKLSLPPLSSPQNEETERVNV